MQLPCSQASAKSKDTPQEIKIRKCLSVMDLTDSARMSLDGYYHDPAGRKISIHFDGVIKFPGNVDGNLKVEGGAIKRDGLYRTVDGKSFFLPSGTKDWAKIEPNTFNRYDENPFFKVLNLILELSHNPEYLKGEILYEPQILDGEDNDYLRMDIDLAELLADSKDSSQPEKLTYFMSDLAGKTGTAQMWIERKTCHLHKLAIDVDGFGKSQKPLGFAITFSDFNAPVEITKPAHF